MTPAKPAAPTPHPHDASEPCPGGCDDVAYVNSRLDEGDERMTRIEAALQKNCQDTTEVLEILRMGKAFFRVAGYFGALVKWALPVGASLVSFYYVIKNGGKS